MRGHSKLLMDALPLVDMSDKELRENVAKAQRGDGAAKVVVLGAVMRRVYWLAQRYERLDLLDDLIQEGAMAVMEAIDKFDPERAKDSSFISYMTLWVKSRIRGHLKKDVQIRTHDKGVEYVSMDAPIADDERVWHDVLESDSQSPDTQCQLSHDAIVIRGLVHELDDKERDAIIMTFGLGREPMPRHEYARRCGVTGQTIYNRVQSGIGKMRKIMKGRHNEHQQKDNE